mmetsp:Transcript_38652/g.152640  ORF Transcript_38652/g.152640 Transcript_38652/m.152640 type:complete len:149 (+) Transcript_38652:1383-1829(+)
MTETELFTFRWTGASGHGVCEELDIPRDEIEVSGGDFSPALGTIGGFIVGERIVVNHQRLSGAGYCFSAAQPPYLATAAIEGTDRDSLTCLLGFGVFGSVLTNSFPFCSHELVGFRGRITSCETATVNAQVSRSPVRGMRKICRGTWR